MTPENAIASLDRQIAQHGQEITLTRVTGVANQAKFTATMRAFVRGYSREELTSTIIQGDTLVILSPTHIEASRWPGPKVANPTGPKTYPRVPLATDPMVIAGKTRTIQYADPTYINGKLAKIKVQVRG